MTLMVTDIPNYFSPDFLRLLVIPAFMYAAFLDYKYRVVYNEFWMPLIGLCFLIITWEVLLLILGIEPISSDFLFNLSTSIIVGPSVAFLLYSNNIIGGADMKGIAYLSVAFPEFPSVLSTSYVVYEGITPVFSITVLTNALMISFIYRIYIIIHNAINGNVNSKMTRIKCIDKEKLMNHSGELIIDEQGSTKLKISVIKSYLNWRGITARKLFTNNKTNEDRIVSEKRPYESNSIRPLNSSNAAELIHLPKTRNTNSISTDESNQYVNEYVKTLHDKYDEDEYDIDPEKIEKAIEKLQSQDKVWVTPSIPFFIPLTVGLVIAIGFGSLYVAGIETAAQAVVAVLT